MKTNLLKLAFLAMLFISPLLSNAQFSIMSPTGGSGSASPVCPGVTSGDLTVVVSTTSGNSSISWAFDPLFMPAGAVLNPGAALPAGTGLSLSIASITGGIEAGTALIKATITNDTPGSPTVYISFTVEVIAAPEIAMISNLSGLDVLCSGASSISLSATAVGADKYEWFKDGTSVAFGASSTYSATTAGIYTVRGKNDCGFGSSSAGSIPITAGITTAITSQPSDVTLTTGQTMATFTVGADGTDLTYQWLKDNSPISHADFAGVNSATLVISNAGDWVGPQFSCLVQGACGSATFTSQVVLPIDLLSFSGKLDKNSTLLNWSTATEYNNDYFTIERSYNGKNFDAIATAKGAGESNDILEYSFIDKTVLSKASSNTVYYRLRQDDFDGAFSYSDIISINIDRKTGLDITNIIQDSDVLDVFISSKSNSNLVLSVYDLNGRIVSQQDITTTEGNNKFSLDVSNTSNGIYIVSLIGNKTKLVKKVFLK